jgi:hypothetical protein
MDTQDFSIIIEKNAISILLFLKNGPRKENDLTDIVSNFYSVEKALDKLRDAGLVRSWVDTTRYHARWHQLTEQGEMVAKKLKEIENIMKGSTSKEDEPIDYEAPEEEGDSVDLLH